MVNRGWVEAPPARADFADVMRDIAQPEGDQVLRGSIYVPVGTPVVLKQDDLSSVWPLRVQWLDIERIGVLLERPLFPYSVRLEPGEQGALQVDWEPINTRPEKHAGYAVQWFLMAAALIVFWVYSSLRRI